MLLLFVAALVASTVSVAQSPLSPQALGPEPGQQGPVAIQPEPDGGLATRLTGWLLVQQARLHQTLAAQLRELRTSPGSGWALLWASFLYGVLHAVGPGHGKFIIGSYVATQRIRRTRAIGLALGSALLQAVSAIVLVFTLVGIAGWLSRDVLGQVVAIEPISFALIAALGLGLCLRAVLRLARRRHAHTGHGCCDHGMEAASEANGWALWGALLAVGSRPCSGAVLVLIAAHLLGVVWLGAGAALAMALGTGLTVALLAVLTVEGRDRLGGFLGDRFGNGVIWLGDGIALVGGVLILMVGALLLWGSWAAPDALLYRL